jgi:hypothetical protein
MDFFYFYNLARNDLYILHLLDVKGTGLKFISQKWLEKNLQKNL